MTDCPNGEIRDLLPAYLNDRVSAATRAEVDAHLAVCGDCRAELALLRDLRMTMARVPAVDPKAIAAAIEPYRAPGRRTSSTGWRAAAAIIAIAVGGTSIALLREAGDRPASSVRSTVAIAPAAVRRDSAAVAIASTPAPARANGDSAPRGEVARPVSSGELAIASSAIGELSDRELVALVEDLESLDALPSTELEGAGTAPSLPEEESR